jgi:hypothetical protein
MSPSPYLKTETDPFFEKFCFIVFRISDDGQSPQKHSDSEYYAPYSEPFNFYYFVIFVHLHVHLILEMTHNKKNITAALSQ